jgi:hypothetical protein
MPAYGQLLVDDPERIGPVQAIGMDQTQLPRVGECRTQQWATTFADVAGHRLRALTEGAPVPEAEVGRARLRTSRQRALQAYLRISQ